MVAALQQVDAGRPAADVGREVGVSAATIYAWKAKYGGTTDPLGTQGSLTLSQDQIRLVFARLLRAELIRRKFEVARQIFNCPDVGAYGTLRVIPTLEFFEHHFS
jgi:hypothetical protein